MLDKEAMKSILEQMALCIEESKYTAIKRDTLITETEGIKSQSDIQKREDSLIYSQLSILYLTQGSTLAIIYVLLEEMNRLPKKDEINHIQTELSSKINETLSPIVEEFKKLKELEKRGSDIYQ